MNENETLYTRHVSPAGRVTYLPHSHVKDMRGLEPGHYLVWIKKGCTSIKWLHERLTPARAKVQAAVEELKEGMLKAMGEKNKMGGCRELSRDVEEKGWKAFRKATGSDGPLTFDGCSMQDVVDAGVGVLFEAK